MPYFLLRYYVDPRDDASIVAVNGSLVLSGYVPLSPILGLDEVTETPLVLLGYAPSSSILGLDEVTETPLVLLGYAPSSPILGLDQTSPSVTLKGYDANIVGTVLQLDVNTTRIGFQAYAL